MTVAAYDSSRTAGSPIELYLFRYGTDPSARIALTDAEEPVTYGGITYEPAPISREAIVSGQSLDKSEMPVRTTLTSPVAELFRITPPTDKVTLVIRYGHAGDPDNDFDVVWVGAVLQCKRDGREAELTCRPDSIAVKRPGLRGHYQLSCPHALYSTGTGLCNATKVLQPAVMAEAVGYLNVRLASDWEGAYEPGKYLGGMIEWDTANGREYRTIIRRSGDTVYLNAPTTGLIPGAMVNLVLGCNHLQSDCAALHDNILNFGGCPYIPKENPIRKNPFT